MLCFLCKESDEGVKEFDDESFSKCRLMLAFRRYKNHAHGEVKLHQNNSKEFGKHSQCYKKVTNLKSKLRDEFEDFCKNFEENDDIDAENHDSSQSKTTENQGKLNAQKEKCDGPFFEPMDVDAFVSATQEDPIVLSSRQKSTVGGDNSLTSRDSSMPDKSSAAPPKKLKRQTCVICDLVQKSVGRQKVCTSITNSLDFIESIREAARNLNDTSLLSKLENCIEIPYHPTCLLIYKRESGRVAMQQSVSEPSTRKLHQEAFASISVIIRRDIIENGKVMYLSDLFERYKALLQEFQGGRATTSVISNFRMNHLENKIITAFGDTVTVELSLCRNGKRIVYKKDLNVSQLAGEMAEKDKNNENKMENVAYYLRNLITSMDGIKLPNENLSLNDVFKGECDIPEELLSFVSKIVQGPDVRRQDSDDDLVRINSICSDIIYATTKGRVKPKKHLMLGTAMKSITSSRKVMTILNRYGHTIGYNLAEEIETELTYTAHNNNSLIPSGIIPTIGLCTNVAFDNFDRFVDTTSGKDTLHDTVGIIYQFIGHGNVTCNESAAIENLLPSTSYEAGHETSGPALRKRRRFEVVRNDIQPYYKKLTTNMTLLTSQEIEAVLRDCEIEKAMAATKDVVWVMSLSLCKSKLMWLGFNCKTFIDNSERQVVDYLPPINSSPTSNAVVRETMERAKEIAVQCNQDEIIVTFDLAIAKIAMQIQKTESPSFDALFINLGGFHIFLAFFKALGKFIESSGLIEVVVQAEVLANGSVNCFLDGKHFNRCKRIHVLLAAALQVLHFERFQSENEFSPETLADDLDYLLENPTDRKFHLELSPSLQTVVAQYERYCEQTLSGRHGKTAQYYMLYVELQRKYLNLSRAIRSSDLELYVDSIFEMANLFFAFNQPNYARWSVLYASNLIKLKLNDSPLVWDFARGAFGVKRTDGNFSRSPVDLTLEQTINADAANTLTGIGHFTNSIEARERWAASHALRTKIISKLMTDIKLTRNDDVATSLLKSRVEKDEKALESILMSLRANVNPFDKNIDQNQLFNVSTGRAASVEVSDFLLGAETLGRDQKVKFIDDCNVDESRFSKPIKRNKILNFSHDCLRKTQNSGKNGKQALLKMERDIFGRLLSIAIEKKVDLEHCFSYPLAPAPPALFQSNGDMFKTDKSVLAKTLKSHVESTGPDGVDILLLDGFYFLHIQGASMPSTFDSISKTILTKLCAHGAPEIHLIFDRYLTPSIKDSERQNRSEYDVDYNITGPQQTRPVNFIAALKNYKFKEALVRFLSQHWENDCMAPIIKTKKVILTVDDRSFSFTCEDNRVRKLEESSFQCTHEEADTRIIFHISKANPQSKILVKASDTDVLVILLGNIHKFPSMQIWIDNGNANKNNQTCTNCTELASKLGLSLCQALPGFHAYTGSDYTAAFFRKGKLRPYRLLEKSLKFQNVFSSLKNMTVLSDDDIMKGLHEFTCLMYGLKNCFSVNSARYEIFKKTYSRKKLERNFLQSVKSFDSSNIPPCWKSLKQKLLRSIFVTSMWLNATESSCAFSNPEKYGWNLDVSLQPTHFEGDPTPLSVEDILIADKDNDDLSEENDHLPNDFDSSDSDSE